MDGPVMYGAKEAAEIRQQKTDALRKNINGAGERLKVEVLRASLRQMQRLVYAHPIPPTKDGRPRWIRRGALARAESAALEETPEGPVITLRNNVRAEGSGYNYARLRHDRTDTEWPAPWRKFALEELRNTQRLMYQDALRSALAEGRIHIGFAER